MPTIRERIAKYLLSVIPQARVTRYDTRAMPGEIASRVDVDRVLGILRSAEAGDCTNLFALYRDILIGHAHLQGRFTERKEAVIGDALNIRPMDKTAKDDVAASGVIGAQLSELVSLETALLHLLDSTLWPVSVVEKVFMPGTVTVAGVKLDYTISELVPVPYELLYFALGRLQIQDTDKNGFPMASYHDPDPARYIVHRAHTLSVADNWGGPMRSLVFWWLLGTMDRQWWARFLDRYATPFLVGKYDQADDESRSILERAFSLSTKLGGLVVSRQTEIEIKQAAASDSGQAFEAFHKICNEEYSKLIAGQTLSADAKATGMGSGVAKNQDKATESKRQHDARRLGATLRNQLFRQLLQINGLPGQVPKAIWGSVSTEERAASATVLVALNQASLQVADEGLDELSEQFGWPIERVAPPPAPDPMANPAAMLKGLRTHAAPGVTEKARAANESIMRTAAGRLAAQLREDYGPVEAILLTSRSSSEFLDKLETYCASQDPLKAAEIMEAGMAAMAANGAVASVK